MVPNTPYISILEFFYFFSGQSEHCKRALSLMDFDKINYNLIESTIEHILESDEYPQEGSILVFLPGKNL